jgi:hypothetical protein
MENNGARSSSRYYLVDNGHIHTGAWSGCGIGPRTLGEWLTALEGKTYAEAHAALAAEGRAAVLCAKCFPTAPVEMMEPVKAGPDLTGKCAGSLTDVSRSAQTKPKCPVCQGRFGKRNGLLNIHKPW